MKCNLSNIMKENHCTIEAVDKSVGLSRTTITELYYDRACRINYSTIDKLCSYFQIGIDELFGIDVHLGQK